MNSPKDISLEELKNSYKHFLTVGQLKEFLTKHNLPDDAKVVVQRIEDDYYSKHNWSTLKKQGEESYYFKKWNDDCDSGKYDDKEEYPLITDEQRSFRYTQDQLDEARDEYTPVWSCVKYNDDPNNLYLDLHY